MWFAFLGAAVAAVLVQVVASLGRDGATPVKLAIAGAAVTAAVSSWTSAVLLVDRQTMATFRLWQVGTVGGRGFEVLLTGLPFLVVGAVLALTGARVLNALALGDDVARGLGRRTAVDRVVIGVAVVLLAGTGAALAGPIAFVGLMAPHAVRALVGGDYAVVLPLSALVGAAVTVLADTARPGRAAAVGGAGRDHDRGGGRARLPAPDPARPGGGAVMTTALLDPEGRVEVDVAAVRRARGRGRRRHRGVIGGLAAVLVAVLAARVLLGDYTVTVPDFVRILTGTEIPGASYIVLESKLPRAVLGALVGVAFGVSGAIFQATLRNALASPDIIGISLGASAAAVVAIVLVGLEGTAVSVVAVAGALGVAAVVRLTAGTSGGHKLVLVGIGAAAALQAVIQYVFTRVDEYDAQLVLRWLTGSVSRADWPTIRLLAVLLLVLLPVTAVLARSLRATELGEDAAAGLGVTPRRTDLLLVLGVLLSAVGVAAAGPIAFVSFLAGPIARALNAGRTTLLGAGLTGAVIVVGGDYVADYLLADINFPVGVVTGALGAPFLLWLLARGATGRRVA